MAVPSEGLLGPPGARANLQEGRHKKCVGCASSRKSVYAAGTPSLRSGLSVFFVFGWLSAAPTVLLSGPVPEEAGAGGHLSRRVSSKRSLDRKLLGGFKLKIKNHRENP